ncbi:hypothetical protein PENSPDRAFT_344034 [Peniophora sp. CONT]|nr:hypothetical protein PENSPDRAFT_344034 [Peniophora sp. CONT]
MQEASSTWSARCKRALELRALAACADSRRRRDGAVGLSTFGPTTPVGARLLRILFSTSSYLHQYTGSSIRNNCVGRSQSAYALAPSKFGLCGVSNASPLLAQSNHLEKAARCQQRAIARRDEHSGRSSRSFCTYSQKAPPPSIICHHNNH